MEKILAYHAPILKDIQRIIGQKYRINSDHIRPVNFSIVDGSIMKFQLSFDYALNGPVQNYLLNFELRDISPESLYFDTLAGLKGYEKSNNYHGLEGEIIKYIESDLSE
ncbi:MAG: hypothetical protein HQ507_08710 [Candidatus Marinimicrobia bacterium]|nr:hypothetical protein [Candidatus Neomarinimicrobiota bacterium]